MTPLSQIDTWLKVPSEHECLEFKEAKTQFDNTKLFEYCIALANEGGGKLILGVTDKKPRKVVGSAAFNDTVVMAQVLFEAVGFRVDIEEISHPDGRVLIFHVPGRPSGTVLAYKGKYLMRVGESLQPMTEDKLREIFAEGQPDWLQQPAQHDCSAADVVRLLDTQTFFDLLNLPYPSDQTGVLDKLQGEHLIEPSAAGFTISNLGALMLAKDLKAFGDLSRKAARVIVYVGKNKLNTRSDQFGGKGYAVGFKGLVKYVMDQLPQNEVIEDALRVESKLLPEVVVRELLANALIHQDFTRSGMSPVVEIYEDRVEISNPGTPVVKPERFVDAYQSRNERMADLMRRLGICEEKGSGIDRTVKAAEDLQLPAPDFLAEHDRTVALLFGPTPFKKMDREDRIRACWQHCALQHVSRQPMTNQSLRERFKLSDSSSNTVSKIITDTIDAGFIKLDPNAPSSKKYARYLPHWA
jgi:predicted HTH transcriptional regulator